MDKTPCPTPPRRHPLPALAATLLAAALATGPAAAALVYSNGGPDFSGALVSDADGPAQGADAFSVPAGGGDPLLVTRLRFWGSYLGGPVPAADDFSFRLLNHSNISQVMFERHFSAAEVQRSANPVGYWTHIDALGQSQQVGVYAYEAPVLFALVPDHDYYASIVGDTVGDTADWLWAFSSGGDGTSLWQHGQAWWAAQDADFAYQLIGPGDEPGQPVPEPTTGALVALAALAALATHRFPNRPRKDLR